MEPAVSLPLSQEPVTGACPEPDESSPHLHCFFNTALPSAYRSPKNSSLYTNCSSIACELRAYMPCPCYYSRFDHPDNMKVLIMKSSPSSCVTLACRQETIWIKKMKLKHASIQMKHKHTNIKMKHKHANMKMWNKHASIRMKRKHANMEMWHKHASIRMKHKHTNIKNEA